jgi:hypothetical protein
MFRLIKLAMYALVGYVLYELYQGMSAQAQQQGGGSGRQRMGRALERAGQAIGGGGGGMSDQGAGDQNFTGAGEGQTENTLNSDGGSVPHRVGRGVTTP